MKQDRLLLHLKFLYETHDYELESYNADWPPNEKLKYLQKEKGLSVSELAKKVGVNESTITKWRCGYKHIGCEQAKVLAAVLEIDEHDLFDDYCKFVDYPFDILCKNIRKELGLSLGQIGNELNIAGKTFRDWEAGKNVPIRSLFERLIKYLDAHGKSDLIQIDYKQENK